MPPSPQRQRGGMRAPASANMTGETSHLRAIGPSGGQVSAPPICVAKPSAAFGRLSTIAKRRQVTLNISALSEGWQG